MNENTCPAHHHDHPGMFLPVIVPLAIGFMLGVRKGLHMQHAGGPRHNWEQGIPPFFAEMHRRAHAAEAQPAPAQPADAQPAAPQA